MKKLISIIMIIVLMASNLCFYSSARGEPPVVRGDANCDDVINAKDAFAMKKMILGIDAYNKNADLVEDGVVNAKDLLYFNKLMVGVPYNDKDKTLTVYSVDRKTFQSFLDNMSINVLRNSEGSMVEDHFIVEYLGESSTRKVLNRLDLKTGELSIEWNKDYELHYNSWWWTYYSIPYIYHINVYNDPDQLKLLFSEHGIELEGDPEVVCMIDTPYRYPVVWFKCDGENYFIEYIVNENFKIVQEVYTEEEYLAYAKERKATVQVNGVEIDDKHATILEDYCIVSFTSLLEAIGAQVEWTGERYAKITYNDKHYILKEDPDFYNYPVFYGVDNEVNYDFIVSSWGGGKATPIEWEENDILLCPERVRCLLSELVNDGVYDAYMLDADFDNDIIIINYGKE